MEKFTIVTGVAAPLPEADLDTDIIFPARFLLLMEKAGLGKHLFHERRYNRPVGEAPFVLNTPPFNQARILVAGRNFGSGSSREQAVWALMDFGFRCVIAPSFGEIFHANSFKNGLLCIVQPAPVVDTIMAAAGSGAPLSVDLVEQTIALPNGEKIPFSIDPHSRQALLKGLDEIDLIFTEDSAAIAQFEAAQRRRAPWLYLDRGQLAYFDDILKATTAENERS
jgi:3-isopropylmalate/(R)-2-methylmalate dehydratase small subunit